MACYSGVVARKKQIFSATKAVKAAAREHLGAPPPARVDPGKKERLERKKRKHKPTVERLLEGEG